MTRSNLHTHTTYVDGANSPEEMVLAAIERGFVSLGFSEHAYTAFDSTCCLTPESTLQYFEEVRTLANKYANRLSIFLGLEIDWLEPLSYPALDYVIGSVHTLSQNGTYFIVDNTPEMLADCKEQAFHGDGVAMAKAYFRSVSEMAAGLRPSIIGHFDLVTKFNETGVYFDESCPAYQKAALEALDAVIDTGAIVEVNTGAMSRGWRTTPYPAPFLLRRLLERKAPIILSTDTHAATTIDYAFAETTAMLKNIGFAAQMELTKQGFVEVSL